MPNENIDYDGWGSYTATQEVFERHELQVLCRVKFAFKRINIYGYGVSRLPTAALDILATCKDDTLFEMWSYPVNRDVIPVVFEAQRQSLRDLISSIAVLLLSRPVTGAYRGDSRNYQDIIYVTDPDYEDEIDYSIILTGADGMFTKDSIRRLLQETTKPNYYQPAVSLLVDADLRRDAEGDIFTKAVHSMQISYAFLVLVATAGDSYMDLDYYQIQWGILHEGEYLAPTAAKEACQIYEWCRNGGDAAE